MAVVRKHKLEYTEHFDFLLLGIVSAENDYRFIWQINKKLGFEFEKTQSHKVKVKGTETEPEFSHYVFEHDGLYLLFRLIGNKSPDGVLIEELKNIDYLLIVQGEMTESYIRDLISGLKAIEQIQGVFRIDPISLKNREKLLI